MTRRQRLIVFLIATMAGAASTAVAQTKQTFPVKPIRLVVAFSAGGTPDTLARMLGPRMSETWKQPVVVENRPGAGATMHVGFKGQPEFLLEIVAGRVHYGVAGLGPAMHFIKEGRLLPLAVAMPQRSAALPDVPAAPEVLPGWRRDGSQTWLAPAGTPRAILNQLNREIVRILNPPEVKERLQSYDFVIAPSTPEEFDIILM